MEHNFTKLYVFDIIFLCVVVENCVYIVIILLYLLTKEGALEESWLF